LSTFSDALAKSEYLN